MPNMNETVAGLTITAKTEGVDQAKSKVDSLTQSTQQLGVVSETASKGARSLEESWKRATLRFDEGARSQAAFARETKLANDAVRNGLATQQQANEHLARVAERYGQASAASRAFAVATSGVNAQLVAMAAGAGPVGTFLAALGPWGFAASVGLGAASAVLNRVVEGAERIGDKSIELKKFSDVTGLTVTQIKGLTQAGGRLGVDSDEISNSLEKFTVGLNEARKGTGSLFDQIRAINPQLAIELAQTTDAAQGWDILAKALRAATDASQRNALARAAFGRGGIETGLVAVESATKGGIDAMAKGIGLTQEWVTETARLRAENKQLEKSIQNAMDAAYALPVLQRQQEFLKWQKGITDEFIKMGKFKMPTPPPSAAAGMFGQELELEQLEPRQRSPFALDRETIAGWQQLDDAMGAAVQKSTQIIDLLQQEKNARALAANTERERLGLLGAVVTEQERVNLKAMELKVALDQNKLSQQDYERAVAGLTKHFDDQLVALRGQLTVAQQVTGIGQINAQYEATIANAKQQGLILSQETAKADAQRAIALAQVNAQADRQLKTLRNEYEIISASSEEEKGRIRARQEYTKLIEEGVSSEKAGAIASQMQANARATQDASDATESWSVQMDKANDAINRVGNGIDRAADEMARLVAESNRLRAALSFVPTITLGLGGGTRDLFQSPQGGYSQFDPAGYTSATSASSLAIAAATAQYGKGGFERDPNDPYGINFLPNSQSINKQVSLISAVNAGASETDPTVRAMQQSLAALQALPESLGTALAIAQTQTGIDQYKDMVQAMKEQTDATNQNTEATQAMTDVLSPFYSSDPRRTHLGYRAFAGGGIMTQYGELPLKQYQGGGIATTPQVAVFGEGSTPEAYVPAPAGKIPVEIKTPANSNRPVVVNINVMGNADARTVQALKTTAFQQAQAMRRVVG